MEKARRVCIPRQMMGITKLEPQVHIDRLWTHTHDTRMRQGYQLENGNTSSVQAGES